MALDFDTIKKIDAGGINVGMIQNSAGDILWRKKYDKLEVEYVTAFVDPHSGETVAYGCEPYGAVTPSNLLMPNYAPYKYFWYGDKVKIITDITGKYRQMVTWSDDNDSPNRFAGSLFTLSLVNTYPISYSSFTNRANMSRTIWFPGVSLDLGSITQQTAYNNYGGRATDSVACVVGGSTFSDGDYNETAPGDIEYLARGKTTDNACVMKIRNGYFVFNGSAQTSKPSGNYVEVVTSKPNYPPADAYQAIFTLRGNFLYPVAFFAVVRNTYPSTSENYELVVLNAPGSQVSLTCYGTNSYIEVRDTTDGYSEISANPNNYKLRINKQALSLTHNWYLPLVQKIPYWSSTSYYFNQNSTGEVYTTDMTSKSYFAYAFFAFTMPNKKFKKLRVTYNAVHSSSRVNTAIFSKINCPLCPNNNVETNSNEIGFGPKAFAHRVTVTGNGLKYDYDLSSYKEGDQLYFVVKYVHKTTGYKDDFRITDIKFIGDYEFSPIAYNPSTSYYEFTVKNNKTTGASFKWINLYIEGSEEDYTYPLDDEGLTIAAGQTRTIQAPDEMIGQQSGRVFGLFKLDGQEYTLWVA